MTAYRESLSKEEALTYPVDAFHGVIKVIDTMEKLNAVMDEVRQNDLLGFDTETRPCFSKGHHNKVALLQLSSDTTAWLIRINRIGLPDCVKDVLADPAVIKVGNAVGQDITTLCRVSPFAASGFVDLQKFTEQFGIQDKALARMSAIVLGFRLSKAQQLSNWEAETLSGPQQLYAATDAWVCWRMYRKLSAELAGGASE